MLLVSFADATIARLPRPIRPFAERHHELIKFALVGATTFVIDSVIFYTLKLTVLEPKPVTAKIIAGIVAVIASYILNREWSFQNRGGRERHHEALLFFGFSGVGVLLSMAPLWFSSYVLMLRVPEVSLTVENIADFVSAYIVGNLLQMAFRFWAFRCKAVRLKALIAFCRSYRCRAAFRLARLPLVRPGQRMPV